jgi:radical SAM superfamily enzyme YgiQ (UPF0313 family)
MDVLLVNPNSRKENSVEELPLITPPINLMYVAQNLINNGFKTEILDSLALNLQQDELLKKIKKKSPKVIGFPLYSSDLTKMYGLTEKIKKQNKDIKIFFAGHHASALYKDVMKQFPNVDYLVRGEGEFTTVNLMDALEKNKKLENIHGISFRNKNKTYHNVDEKPIQDLDKVPIPSRKLIDTKLYYSRMSKREGVDVLITSRGCPFKCTFCAKLNNIFRSYRLRSIPNVIEEMKMIEETGTKGIEVYDEMFTLKRGRTLDMVKAIKKEKLDFEFRIRTRVTHVDRELLKGLKSIGCSVISYGVESGNQEILNNIEKETTLKKIKKAFSKTEKTNINVLGFFMIGNRGDTPETIRQTINFAKKLNPLFATFGVLQPFPGTLDYELAKRNGTLQGNYAPFKPRPWIKLPWTKSVKQLYEYSNMAYNEFYKRPTYIAKFLKSTISQGNWNLIKYTVRNFYRKISSINPL